jgi:hypothetical protein
MVINVARYVYSVSLLKLLLDLRKLLLLQTVAGAHPASYPMGTGALPPGVKRPWREADISPPFSTKIKNGGAILPLTHTSSWRSA